MISGLENLTRRLLVVDDDPALLQMMLWTFSDLGYQVGVASSCREALELASTRIFDFALLDYHLPDGDGMELMESLSRQQPDLRSILMSGNPPVHLDNQAHSRAACLVKPVSTTMLHGIFSELTVR